MAFDVTQHWYNQSYWRWLVSPLTALFYMMSNLRRLAYRYGLLKRCQLSKPVVIVGNINVGGSGKTPCVVALVKLMQARGVRVGILSRGYKAQCKTFPKRVEKDDLPQWVGDEPFLLARTTQAPVVIDPVRSRGGQFLIDACGVDMIIMDDGLQHYALKRDFELVVVDGQKGFGNGWLLPSGPLREGLNRLKSVSALVINGNDNSQPPLEASIKPSNADFMIGQMQIKPKQWVHVVSGETKPLDAFHGMLAKAYAGIGHPERFFELAEKQGLSIERYPMEDHHSYHLQDFTQKDALIIMTEKDAVKCQNFALTNAWYLEVGAEFSQPSFEEKVEKALLACLQTNKT